MVLGWGGLIASNLRRIKVVGMGEEIRWSGDCIDLFFCKLVHLLEFLDAALEFCHFGPAHGQVFIWLDIFWIAITISRTVHQNSTTFGVAGYSGCCGWNIHWLCAVWIYSTCFSCMEDKFSRIYIHLYNRLISVYNTYMINWVMGKTLLWYWMSSTNKLFLKVVLITMLSILIVFLSKK